MAGEGSESEQAVRPIDISDRNGAAKEERRKSPLSTLHSPLSRKCLYRFEGSQRADAKAKPSGEAEGSIGEQNNLHSSLSTLHSGNRVAVAAHLENCTGKTFNIQSSEMDLAGFQSKRDS